MIEFEVNGKAVSSDSPDDTPLLWVIRDELKLKGTKFGCGIAQCGACTVHVNGRAQRACVTPVSAVEGADVRTIEGVEGETAEAVQGAWVALDVPQCGYGQSGQVMSAVALLDAKPDPSDEEIENAMSGNLCRCNCYARIRQAVRDAADAKGATS